MTHYPQFKLRPLATGQHSIWLARCTFVDGYLYLRNGKLYYSLEVRKKPDHRSNTPTQQIMYLLECDIFGVYQARLVMAALDGLGAAIRVDDLKQFAPIQRAALRRICVSLARGLVAATWSERECRYSTKLHCLRPAPCDPFDGLRNHYETSPRAIRDREAKRRAAEKRDTQALAGNAPKAKRTRTSSTGVRKRPSTWGLDKPQNTLIGKSD